MQKETPEQTEKNQVKISVETVEKEVLSPPDLFPGHFNVASKMLQPLAMLVFCTSFSPLISPFR